ncbi:hypothetical protein D3227_02970 [Mesorhizobium waimense]|uniref:DJ-1/PfpI domain-containing protein n=2 Tax=Mesorhizobium waimense TaxID=1300307 RepID=A0A3A5L820_9HYPH|nr:hypothetical protein D3227_02970 [Mesorhizobium waimense]
MASFVDALRLAADKQDHSRQVYFAWDFISAGPSPVRASCGLEMTPAGNLDDPEAYDCIAVCGGLIPDLAGIHPATFEYLRAVNARGIPLVGLCTGSFVLAQAGLLEHRECALHFDTLGEFLSRFPNSNPATSQNYVIDGNIITCPGSIVAIDIAAFLIARYSDAARARKALNYLLFKPEESRIVLKAKPYEEALGSAARLTVEAVKAMETRIDSPCSIEDLALSLNTTKNTIEPRFPCRPADGPCSVLATDSLDGGARTPEQSAAQRDRNRLRNRFQRHRAFLQRIQEALFDDSSGVRANYAERCCRIRRLE